jgi:beta-N-acetylhexosaminidase
LYGGNFTRAGLYPSILDLDTVGEGGATTFEVARRGATLISPAQEQLLEELGEPPGTGEAIVIFTDVRQVSQCSTCEPFEEIGKDDLASEILNLYGPLGTGQISEQNLTSFSMADLAAYLGEQAPLEVAESLALEYSIEVALQTSDWLIFSVFKTSDEIFGSEGLKLLLDRRPDLVRNKRVVVFVYDVPYDMDATDISKIDAYYALYSRSEEFVEVAARMLFQEIPATGASPVNVPGVGYDLIDVLTPDPTQTITLHVIYDDEETSEEATPTGFRRGDLIHVATGVIVDANGNPVPDGTPVSFDIAYQAEGIAPVRIETVTTDGVGAMSLTLDRLGTLTIQAASELARTSEILQLEVQEDAFSVVTVIPPTGTPIATIGPTGTASESVGESGEPVDGQEGSAADLHTTNLLDLAIGLLGVVLVSGAGFLLTRRQGDEQTAIRFALIGAVFGLAGYDYLAIGLPGSEMLLESSGLWSSLVVTIVAGILGQTLWAVGWVIWGRIKSN